MHTMQLDDHITIHYDGDFRGDVHIVRTPPGEPQSQVVVPSTALFEFVGRALQSRLIEDVEQMDGREFLFHLSLLPPHPDRTSGQVEDILAGAGRALRS